MEIRSSESLNLKKSVYDFAKNHPFILSFAICVLLCSFSFMEQHEISSGNRFFMLAIACLVCVALVYLISTQFALSKTKLSLIFAGFIFCAFVFFKFFSPSHSKAAIIGASGIVFLLIVTIFLIATKKMTCENAIILIFLAGIIIRFTYVLYTSAQARQHDVYGFENDGHSGYIKYLFDNNFKLPDFDPTLIDQFYHPPLHHLISAAWWKILSNLGVLDYYAQESIQTLTLFYSICCSILTYKILRKFNVKGLTLVALFAIISFHPTFIIFSASINNDILSVTLMLSALYTSLKWFESQKLKDILLTGLFIGLAMFTKLSAYMICVPIAILFAVKFFQNLKEYKKYLIQFGLFLLICAPIALFWSVRNAVLYNVPINFVQKLGEDSWQYVGNHTVIERLFDFSPKLFESVFDQWLYRGNNLYNEYNPMISLLKTSMFEEFINDTAFKNITLVSIILFYSNIIIVLVSLVALGYLVFAMIKDRKVCFRTLSIMIAWLAMVVFYYIFCFEFPHHCTENIRYVSPTIIFGLIFMGLAKNRIEEKASVEGASNALVKTDKILSNSFATLAGIFSFFAVMMFLLMS